MSQDTGASKAVQRPEPYPGNPETWHGEWLEHPIEWIKECFRRAHDTLTHRENSYSMSIPVQRWDPDIVLGDAIEELERLRAENARLKQDNADAYRRLGIAVGTE